jgi:hypothetical protein
MAQIINMFEYVTTKAIDTKQDIWVKRLLLVISKPNTPREAKIIPMERKRNEIHYRKG